jgi:hypothetical protein
MKQVKIPYIVCDNILANKFDIKALSIVNSSNPKHIEEIQGNQLRTMKKVPLIYDYMVNLISNLKKDANDFNLSVFSLINDNEEDYYSVILNDSDYLNDYIKYSNHYEKRRSLLRQLSNCNIDYVFLKNRDSIRQMQPFNIITDYEDNQIRYKIRFSKLIFKPLIEDNNSDGFTLIPSNLYPISTIADLHHTGNKYKGQKVLGSPNPLYKLNMYGLRLNTNKVDYIEVDKQEFFKNVAPELILNKQVNKYHLKIPESVICNSLKPGLLAINQNISNSLIVKNVFLGYRDKVTIHFLNYDKKRK